MASKVAAKADEIMREDPTIARAQAVSLAFKEFENWKADFHQNNLVSLVDLNGVKAQKSIILKKNIMWKILKILY